jgi:hypothetical protein
MRWFREHMFIRPRKKNICETDNGRGTATLVGLTMMPVIAAVFLGIYFYFKKKNSTYTVLKDQQIPCGNIGTSCDLVQGGERRQR